MTYNLLSYYVIGQWVVFVGGFGSFFQSGSGIHSYVLCLGWAFHWQCCGGLLWGLLWGLLVGFLEGCDCCVACGFSHLLMARDVLGLWWIVRDGRGSLRILWGCIFFCWPVSGGLWAVLSGNWGLLQHSFYPRNHLQVDTK